MTVQPHPSADADPASLAELACERSNLYGFFAAVFSNEASDEMLELIKSPDFLEAFFDAGGQFDLEFLRRTNDQLREELAVEFSALFLGPGEHISPHESVQSSSGGGRLWGPETSGVKNFIEAAGFEYKNSYTGLPDHIGVEFEFMEQITKQESEAWRKQDFEAAVNVLDIEQTFMKIHLAAWAIEFCRKVTKMAEHPFYGQLAKLASEFLESEKDELPRRLKLASEKLVN